MPTTCKNCARLEAAYSLLQTDQIAGLDAIAARIAPFLEHLSKAETSAYNLAMKAHAKSREDDLQSAKVFLVEYGRHLAGILRSQGCDIALARREVRSWVTPQDEDYTALRIGLSLIERARSHNSGDTNNQTMTA